MTQTKPQPLDLEKIENEIDCGSIEFWKRWWNAIELDQPKIVSELNFGIKALLLSKTKDERKLLLEGTYESISKYFEDAVNFGKYLMLKELKQRIKSACKFYLRYKDDPSLFWDEQKEYRKLLKKDLGHIIIRWETMKRFRDSRDKYNDWLFKLAFKDVFEDGDL